MKQKYLLLILFICVIQSANSLNVNYGRSYNLQYDDKINLIDGGVTPITETMAPTISVYSLANSPYYSLSISPGESSTIYYRINGSDWKTYSGIVELQDNGYFLIESYAKAYGKSISSTVSYRLDLQKVEKKFYRGFMNSFGHVPPIGVTADGESQLYIRFENLSSDLPSDYTLNKVINGQIINDEILTGKCGTMQCLIDGSTGFIYSAPIDFSESFSGINSYDVWLELEATKNNGTHIKGKTSIKVFRPGVLMLHGYWSDNSCFEKLKNYLLLLGGYEPFQLLNGNYKESNKQSFEYNTKINRVVDNHLLQLFHSLADNGIVSSKYDVIGHSMGGILLRKYAQEINPNAINRIITLDTPHTGSELAIFADDAIKIPIEIASLIPKSTPRQILVSAAFSSLSLGLIITAGPALIDLGVSSNAIRILNDPQMLEKAKGIPVHAVCSYMVEGTHTDEESCIAVPSAAFASMPIYYLQCAEVYDSDEGFNLYYNLFKDLNDGAVSLTSQAGGLEGSNVSQLNDLYKGLFGRTSNAHHINTHDWIETIVKINKLLHSSKYSANSPFSLNGFSPDLPSSSKEFHSKYNSRSVQVSETAQLELTITKDDESNDLIVNLEPSNDISRYVLYAFLDNEKIFFDINKTNSRLKIPENYEGNVKLISIGVTDDDEYVADMDSIYYESVIDIEMIYFNNNENQEITMTKGQTLYTDVVARWENGAEESIDPSLNTSNDDILYINGQCVTAKKEGEAELMAYYNGHSASIRIVVLPTGKAPGDVNGDNEVNISDINMIIEKIITGEQNVFYDVNEDGELNLADINVIIDLILTQ